MTDKKKQMVRVVLDYIFGDTKSEVLFELPGMYPDEQRVEFTRPSTSKDPHVKIIHKLCWFTNGDFQVWRVGPKGSWVRVHVASVAWFRVGKYLQANFVSVKTELKINVL